MAENQSWPFKHCLRFSPFPTPQLPQTKLNSFCLLYYCAIFFYELLWDITYYSQQQLGLDLWGKKTLCYIFGGQFWKGEGGTAHPNPYLVFTKEENYFWNKYLPLLGREALIQCFAAKFRHSRNPISGKLNFPYKGYKSSSVVALWPTCSFTETWVTQTLKSKTESPALSTAFLLKLGQERSLQTTCSCEWCNTAQGHSVPGKQNCLWMDLDKGPPWKHRMKNSGREILCQLVPKTFRWTRRAP